jgi:hypothetical protein
MRLALDIARHFLSLAAHHASPKPSPLGSPAQLTYYEGTRG